MALGQPNNEHNLIIGGAAAVDDGDAEIPENLGEWIEEFLNELQDHGIIEPAVGDNARNEEWFREY